MPANPISWASREDNTPEHDVDENNAFPVGFYWVEPGETDASPASLEHPVPVQVVNPVDAVEVAGRLFPVGPLEVTGIAAADALDAGDQMGVLLSAAVPRRGAILDARFLDIDFEGLAKEVWIFNGPVTVAASDGPFSISDEDLLAFHVGTLSFSSYNTATQSQVSRSGDTPLWYEAPLDRLWFAVKTLGVDNIAAGKNPRLKFLIERYSNR